MRAGPPAGTRPRLERGWESTRGVRASSLPARTTPEGGERQTEREATGAAPRETPRSGGVTLGRGGGRRARTRTRGRRLKPVMILPQVHLRKPCYDFYFL